MLSLQISLARALLALLVALLALTAPEPVQTAGAAIEELSGGSDTGDTGPLSSNSPECSYETEVTIQFSGDDRTYTLDRTGEQVVRADDSAAMPRALADCGLREPVPDAPTPIGSFTFRPSNPFFETTQPTGTFGQQYTVGANQTTSWYFSISPALRSIATGPANAVVWRTPYVPTNCYSSKIEPVSYYFHGSCRNNLNQEYNLYGSFKFPIYANGAPGQATIEWGFVYWVRPNVCQPGSPC